MVLYLANQLFVVQNKQTHKINTTVIIFMLFHCFNGFITKKQQLALQACHTLPGQK